jgi:hypothetical protein
MGEDIGANILRPYGVAYLSVSLVAMRLRTRWWTSFALVLTSVKLILKSFPPFVPDCRRFGQGFHRF